ncbi:MAG TPA: SIS domain-containing protein [Armatimonadota bacterium]|nr:SIS domain-containing protein [Armatimonadota bacterium]
MDAARAYQDHAFSVLEKIRDTQGDAIRRAAEIWTDVIAAGEIVYILGSGHSLLPAVEAYHRAGGLVPVDVIYDPTFGKAERLPGYAQVLLNKYPVKPNGVIVIISNSGRNALPVEMALLAHDMGIRTIAITNMAHTTQEPSRHPSGKRLFEIADVVIDNCGVYGDAILDIPGVPGKVCPTSGVVGAFIMQSIVAQTIANLRDRDIQPPVLRSANVTGGDEFNREIEARYTGRIRGL